LRRRRAWAGLALVGFAAAGALLAGWVAPYPPAAIDLSAQLQGPSTMHLLGTDFYGRDVLSRLLYGARATLTTAVLAVTLATAVGTAIGLVAGYTEGWAGHLLAGAVDLMLAFPALLLALMVVALLGPGLSALGFAVGIAGIPAYARLVRSLVLSLRSSLYIEAARSIGASPGRILLHHLLPGVVTPVLALVTLDVGRAILNVAGLGFLGLGAPPPLAEWGLMLFEGRQYIATAPWTSTVPGLAITGTVLGASLLGDAIMEARDPYKNGRSK
jgi:peptide/nickel transport system permease protein